jgi:twitching motility protein PilT
MPAAPAAFAGRTGIAIDTDDELAIPAKAPLQVQAPIASSKLAYDNALSDGSTASIDRLLNKLLELKGSDLHVSTGSPPMMRIDGEMRLVAGYDALPAEQVQRMLMPIVPPRNREEFEKSHDSDFAYELPGKARFRANLFVDLRGMGAVMRVIPSKILTTDDLNLPKELLGLCHLPKGLVLVTGPTGSGKSTTLAALVDYINRTLSAHIITIEDPVEFVHPNKKCLVNQRQVGEHTDSFKKALRAALREDPDIVLLGEMRDLETIAIALETAETGHLVFGTLHTSSAPSTIDRIIDQYPPEQQEQIRVMLASSLKGVIAQMLCKKIGGGRVAALEIMFGGAAISNLIREKKIFQIPSIMQTGRKSGMALMNDSLFKLVKDGLVAPEEALAKANDKPGLLATFQGAGIKVEALVT